MNDGEMETTQGLGRLPLVQLSLELRSVVQLIKKSDSGQSILQAFSNP